MEQTSNKMFFSLAPFLGVTVALLQRRLTRCCAEATSTPKAARRLLWSEIATEPRWRFFVVTFLRPSAWKHPWEHAMPISLDRVRPELRLEGGEPLRGNAPGGLKGKGRKS